MRAAKLKKATATQTRQQQSNQQADMPPDHLFADDYSPGEPVKTAQNVANDDLQEQEIVRLLLAFGHELVSWDKIDNMYIGSFIMQNLTDVTFENKLCKKIIDH